MQSEVTTDPISLTERAIEKAKGLIARKGLAGHDPRVAALGGGCSGLKYEVGFVLPPQAGDTVLELSGPRVSVDNQSLVHLQGITVEYVEALRAGGGQVREPEGHAYLRLWGIVCYVSVGPR